MPKINKKEGKNMVVAQHKTKLKAKIETIWDLITETTNCTWRSDLSKIEKTDETHFIEYTKQGYPTYFTIIKQEKPYVYEMLLENGNMKGEWIGKLTSLPNEEVLVEFTEKIEVKKAILKLMVKPFLKSKQKQYFNDLIKEIEKKQRT